MSTDIFECANCKKLFAYMRDLVKHENKKFKCTFVDKPSIKTIRNISETQAKQLKEKDKIISLLKVENKKLQDKIKCHNDLLTENEILKNELDELKRDIICDNKSPIEDELNLDQSHVDLGPSASDLFNLNEIKMEIINQMNSRMDRVEQVILKNNNNKIKMPSCDILDDLLFFRLINPIYEKEEWFFDELGINISEIDKKIDQIYDKIYNREEIENLMLINDENEFVKKLFERIYFNFKVPDKIIFLIVENKILTLSNEKIEEFSEIHNIISELFSNIIKEIEFRIQSDIDHSFVSRLKNIKISTEHINRIRDLCNENRKKVFDLWKFLQIE